MKKSENYWKDYTDFINQVEQLTGSSPSDLLSRYELLISELSDNDQEYYLEWEYEFINDRWTRQKIQDVLEFVSLAENLLLADFNEKITNLDSTMKHYIKNSSQSNWWRKPEIIFKKTKASS